MITPWRRRAVHAAAIAALLSLFAGTAAVEGAPLVAPDRIETPQEPEPAPDIRLTPEQINRIQRALNQPADLRLNERQLRFYLEVVARQPSFAEWAKGYDFINGPSKRGNPMSHQEFLNLVTPKEMYSTAGITPFEQLQFAFTNWVGQSLIRKALEELRTAKSEREIQEIRERIDRELEALTGGRGR
jgi:hypothetical protein